MRKYERGQEFAEEKDRTDPLKSLRSHFHVKENELYMDGNSLGLCSIDAEQAVSRAMSDWKKYGIYLWTGAPKDYFLYHDVIGARMAELIQAEPEEVTACANTTLNIHQCMATFWKPKEGRYRIVMDELNFPTDRYAVVSQIEMRGYDPEDVLKIVRSRDGKTLAEEDLLHAMTEDVALVLLPSVLYRSAQLLPMKKLIEKAHEKGIIIGFDLCHSIGNINHDFTEAAPDFAVWCTYKYLSGGPGAPAGLYINKRHFGRNPGLAGWWGNRKETQFELRSQFEPAENAGGWQTGTGSILSLAAIDGALDVFEGRDMKEIREKSLDLTGYFMFLIDCELSEYGFSVGTPGEDERRGGHVALEHEDAIRINEALKARGVIPDFRYPDVIRIAPVPQYTRYVDIYRLVEILKDIMEKKEYEKFENRAGTVA